MLVSLNVTQLASFTSSLRALHDQAGLTFVVEGFPIQPVLGKEAKAKLQDTTTPVFEAVEKVASLYDYDARKATKGEDVVWILTKRYTDPRDLPHVTTGEIAAFLQDAQRLMSSFNPKVPSFIDPQGHIHPTDPNNQWC